MSTQAESVTQSDIERLPLDIERIHELAEALLPVSEQIDADLPVEDRKLNAKLVELIAILHELHPADVAGLLESLPQKERALVWHLAAPEEDGEVLLEVSDAVRETLIETMDQQELLAAVDDLDAARRGGRGLGGVPAPQGRHDGAAG